MSKYPVEVENVGASYKLVGNNFEYCPLCRTFTSLQNRTVTVLADILVKCGTVQLQDLTEELLEKWLRSKRELNFLDCSIELCHAQINITCLQQAVQERGPSEPSSLTIDSVCTARNTSKQVPQGRSRAGEDIFCPAVPETARSHPQQLVTGRL